eukprot:3878986-Prymnesium_polylepis.2
MGGALPHMAGLLLRVAGGACALGLSRRLLRAWLQVSYAGSVHYELDALYGRWVGGGPAVVTVDLADRIGSTGAARRRDVHVMPT